MLRATETFHAEGERLVAAGDVVHDHDEVVKGREHLFTPEDDKPARGKRPAAATKD